MQAKQVLSAFDGCMIYLYPNITNVYMLDNVSIVSPPLSKEGPSCYSHSNFFLGHFCPRGKGARDYPYVKHQPTRRNKRRRTATTLD